MVVIALSGGSSAPPGSDRRALFRCGVVAQPSIRRPVERRPPNVCAWCACVRVVRVCMFTKTMLLRTTDDKGYIRNLRVLHRVTHAIQTVSKSTDEWNMPTALAMPYDSYILFYTSIRRSIQEYLHGSIQVLTYLLWRISDQC